MLHRSLNNFHFLSLVYYFVRILIDLTDKVLFIFFILFIGFPDNSCFFYIYLISMRSISDIVCIICLCCFLLLHIWASSMLLVILTKLRGCFCVQSNSVYRINVWVWKFVLWFLCSIYNWIYDGYLLKSAMIFIFETMNSREVMAHQINTSDVLYYAALLNII